MLVVRAQRTMCASEWVLGKRTCVQCLLGVYFRDAYSCEIRKRCALGVFNAHSACSVCVFAVRLVVGILGCLINCILRIALSVLLGIVKVTIRKWFRAEPLGCSCG